MKIVLAYPPAWILEGLKQRGLIYNDRTIWTFKSTIYNPSATHVTKDLIAHEEVHEMQQNGDPVTWWKWYLEDPQFRLQEEAHAYSRQYQYLCSQNPNRNYQFQILQALAMILASPMYGSIVNTEEAMRLIKI